MAIYESLSSHKTTLDKLYDDNLGTVQALQKTLSEEILPGLVDELQLDPESEQRAKEWLDDTASIFRVLKRHKFVTSFALESLRTTLFWRVRTLPAPTMFPPCLFLQCLPLAARDSFNRPILVMRLAALLESSDDVRLSLTQNLELLRMHLKRINTRLEGEDQITRPVLQYVALLDVKGMSFKNVQHLELLSWFIYELLPHYPGMLAAVFTLNYTWTYSGMWNVAKRALPASALSRVFFPSQTELTECFAASALPIDLGGELTPASTLEDPLRAQLPITDPPAQTASRSVPSACSLISAPPLAVSLPSMSPLNPFYGYPVSYHAATPTLSHGRRRKRDLLRTLIRLLWARWRAHITAGLWVLLALSALVLARAYRSHRTRWRWRWKPLSASGYAIAALGSIGAARDAP